MKKTELNVNNFNASEEEREKRIAEELKRISALFVGMPKNQRAVIVPIIQNAAFMRVTLEDLQQLILEEGVTDQYQNGANQHGRKQSAALQAYNALVKNYAAVTKTLTQMLPPEKKVNLPLVIMGKTLPQWETIKCEEEEENPLICFDSFEEWIKKKVQDYEPEPGEHGYEWYQKMKKADEDDVTE